MNLEHYIRDIRDFPKEGVTFKDITPLLRDTEASKFCLEELMSLVGDKHIDKVVGVESRGFFYGTLLAQRLQAGFVPVRKPGKLPAKTVSKNYDLEYGTDSLEIHVDAITKGDKVLLHDDVLATGGTAKAVVDLIEELGGEVVQCNFIMTLDFLKGSQSLTNYEVKSILQY